MTGAKPLTIIITVTRREIRATLRQPLRLPYRLYLVLAFLTLLLLGALFRIVFALCAAWAWVKRNLKVSGEPRSKEKVEDSWW